MKLNIGDRVKLTPAAALDPETNYDFSCIGGAKKQKMTFEAAMSFHYTMLIYSGYHHSAKIIGHGADKHVFKVEIKFKNKKTYTTFVEDKHMILLKKAK